MAEFWVLVWALIIVQMAIGFLITHVYYDGNDDVAREVTADG